MAETKRCWSDLPSDILSLILSRLFSIGDRYAFKSVCKSWNLTDCVHIPLTLPPSDDSPYYDSPCLMIPHRGGDSWKIFHSVFNDFYCLDFPELMGARIRYSQFGWLLLSRDSSLFFFNPFSRIKMAVRQDPLSCRSPLTFVSMCFTAPPTEKHCCIFGISSVTFHSIEYGVLYTSGRNNWWSWHSCNNSLRNHISDSPLTYFEGGVYCLDKSGNITVFDGLGPFVTSYKQYDTRYIPKFGKQVQKCHMAVVEKEIWGVFVLTDEDDRQQISVQRLERSEGEGTHWVSLESLGDKCLYVGPNGCFSETNSERGKANTIYFNYFHGRSGVLFSLTTQKFYSINCDFTGAHCSKLTETDSGSAWIKPPMAPPWRRVDNTKYCWQDFL